MNIMTLDKHLSLFYYTATLPWWFPGSGIRVFCLAFGCFQLCVLVDVLLFPGQALQCYSCYFHSSQSLPHLFRFIYWPGLPLTAQARS